STILSLNAKCYLKREGNFAMFIKPLVMSNMDSEDVYAHELKTLQSFDLKPLAGVRLDPYQKRACVIGLRKEKEEEKEEEEDKEDT
ncbi:hypothetical protein MKX03_007441, partial [Papaver bracteatum]